MSGLIRSWLAKEICPELNKLLKQLDDNARCEDGKSLLAALGEDYWEYPYNIQTEKLRLKGQKTVQLGKFVEYGSGPNDTEQKPVVVMFNDSDYFVEAEIDPGYLERFKNRRGTRFTKTKPGTIFVLRVISLKIIGGCKAAFQDGVSYEEQVHASSRRSYPQHLDPRTRKRFDDDETIIYRRPSLLHTVADYLPKNFEKQADPRKIRLLIHEMDLASEGNGNCTGNPRLLMSNSTISERLSHIPVIPEFVPPDEKWEEVWENIMTRYFLEMGWDRYYRTVEDLDEGNVDAVRRVFDDTYLAREFAKRMTGNGSLRSFQETLRNGQFHQFTTPKLRFTLILLQQLSAPLERKDDSIPVIQRFPKLPKPTQRTEASQAFMTQFNEVDWDSPDVWSTQTNSKPDDQEMRDLVSGIQSIYQDDSKLSEPRPTWIELLDKVFKMATRSRSIQQLSLEIKNAKGVRRLFYDFVGDKVPLPPKPERGRPEMSPMASQRRKPDIHAIAKKDITEAPSTSLRRSRPEIHSNTQKDTSMPPPISHQSSSSKIQSKPKHTKGLPRASFSPARSPSPKVNPRNYNRKFGNERTGPNEPADHRKRLSNKTKLVDPVSSDVDAEEREPENAEKSESEEESEVEDEEAAEMAMYSVQDAEKWKAKYQTLHSIGIKTKMVIRELRAQAKPLQLLVVPPDQLEKLNSNTTFYPGFNANLQKKHLQKARQHSDITEDDPNNTTADEKGAVQQPKKKQKRTHAPYSGPSQRVFTMDPSTQNEGQEQADRANKPPHDGDDNDADLDNDKPLNSSQWPSSPSQYERQDNKNNNKDDEVHDSSNDKDVPEPSMDFLNNSPDDTPQEARIFSSSPPPPTPKKKSPPRKAPVAAVAPAFAYEEDEDQMVEGDEAFVPATMPKHTQQQQQRKTETAEIPATAHQVREDKKGHQSDDDPASVPETQLEPEDNVPDNVPASSPSTITGDPHLIDVKDAKDAEYHRVEIESALMMEVDDNNVEEENVAEEIVRLPTPPEDIIPHDFISEHPSQRIVSLASVSMKDYSVRQPPRDNDELPNAGDKDADISKGYVEITRPVIDPELKQQRSSHWRSFFGFRKPKSKAEYREMLGMPENPVVRDLSELVEEQRRAFFGNSK